MRSRTWTVEIVINEYDEERRTRAQARLHADSGSTLHGEGEARRRPSDREVPEIGDELAAARALADLAYRLLDVTAGDIAQFTHQRAHLSS